MTSTNFSAQVRARSGLAVIDLSGEINAFAEGLLNQAYTEAEELGTNAILLNFSRVGYINSTGIALIVALLARARKTNRGFVVCGLSEHYREIFQITRLADFMHIYPDEAAALQAAENVS